MRLFLPAAAFAAVALWACGGSEQSESDAASSAVPDAAAEVSGLAPALDARVAFLAADRGAGYEAVSALGPEGAALRGDREIFEETLRWVLAEGIDTLPIGGAVARIGRRFVGAPYRPGTLDPPGPENLVVNLREFDCVTFVESVLALAHATRADEPSFEEFARVLERLRYRGGVRGDYPSRLHYFSEWLADNARRGILELRTRTLGGDRDPEPIHFMTRHTKAYWQLEDPGTLDAIGRIERRLSDTPRHELPETAIEDAEGGIEEGDVIAATSTLAGLDVAHTGIAVEVDGRIHLMHAPLVGDSVQISQVPLAVRVGRIRTQDGIMVARPL
ncbi:MAG: N-acetylmuramoyl-L-alanine amidase-like domain-containing protein [Gemmatimonadota bacterium]